MLRLDDIHAGYGEAPVLQGVSLDVQPGEVVCLMGRNGAGKTTVLKTIMGLLRVRRGTLTIDGTDLGRLAAHQVPGQGIGYVPQGRRLFADLTVAENLEIGAMVGPRGSEKRANALELFPVLRERLDQRAGTLSGGEQQMAAIARALCTGPRLLLLDEPTEGLQPSIVALIRDVVVRLKAEGTAILLVEQRIDAVRAVADRVVFIENGRTRETVAAATLDDRAELLHRYVGVGA